MISSSEYYQTIQGFKVSIPLNIVSGALARFWFDASQSETARLLTRQTREGTLNQSVTIERSIFNDYLLVTIHLLQIHKSR